MPFPETSKLTYEMVSSRAWPGGPEHRFYRLTCTDHPDFVAICSYAEQVAAQGTKHFVDAHAARRNCPPDHTPDADYGHEVQHCTLPACGDLGSPTGRRTRPAPRESLAQSYTTQGYRLGWDGQQVWVKPDPPSQTAGPEQPCFLISAWHPLGAVVNYPDCQRLHRRLRDKLSRDSHQAVTPAVGVARDQSWFELAHLVEDIDESAAVELAREFGQAAVVRWHRDEMTVIPTGLMAGVERVTVVVGIGRVLSTCPVRDDELEGIQCVRRGGPWGSSPIHLYGVQLFHRSVALSLLGCQACETGLAHLMMQPDLEPQADMAVGSRHGGTYWPWGPRPAGMNSEAPSGLAAHRDWPARRPITSYYALTVVPGGALVQAECFECAEFRPSPCSLKDVARILKRHTRRRHPEWTGEPLPWINERRRTLSWALDDDRERPRPPRNLP